MPVCRGYKQTPEHVAARFRSRAGWKPSEETKRKLSENAVIRAWTDEDKEIQSSIAKEWHRMNPRKGPNNPCFKGRRVIKKYIWAYQPDHPYCKRDGYVLEHRLVMEKMLGRLLGPKEIVHHKDGDKSNNNPGNLLLVTPETHPLSMGEMYRRGYDQGFAAAFVLFSTMNSLGENPNERMESLQQAS